MAACRPAAHGCRPAVQMMQRRTGIDLFGFQESHIFNEGKIF
jgi:hypothetical protein